MKQPTSHTPTRALTARLITFAAIGAYFTVLFFGGLFHGDKMTVLAPDFIIYLNPLTYGIAWLVIAAILVAYGSISKRMVYGYTWLATLCYALWSTVSAQSYTLTFVMCALVGLMTVLVGQARHAEAPLKEKKRSEASAGICRIVTGVVAVLVGGGVLFLALSSYLFHTISPTVSTGVYAQLMSSLRNGFSFDTTLEFGSSVSHMAAHISPIFLLFLPFYAIAPSPLTLLILQVALVYSAVIPLWLIARHRGLSPTLSALLCGLLCLYPAVWGSTAWSFHEYACLLPLLLWLLWALEKHRRVLVWVFAALVLCVRETAAIHLLTVGLYWLVSNRPSTESDGASGRAERKKALWMIGISLVYFTVSMLVLTYFGKGTLITRFANVTGQYATDFGTLIRELLFNPALAVYEMLTEAKLHYVLCLLLPLAALPFLARKKAGLVFLLPLLLLNLLADFPYHFNLDYPYSFGISAFLFYLSVDALATVVTHKNTTDASPHPCRSVARLLTMAVCCTLLIGAFRLSELSPYTDYVFHGRDEVESLNELLDMVDDIEPAGASVSASARLCPALASREELYTLSQEVETDVVIIDLRDEWGIDAEKAYTVSYYEEKGYTLLTVREGVGAVLCWSSDAA